MFRLIFLLVFVFLQFSGCKSQKAGVSAPVSATSAAAAAAALQQLTEFRKNRRRTADGRLCAAAFVQEDQLYTDCTRSRAPNGTQDKIRLKARQAFEMKAAEAEAMV
ncbi:hypothetical protein EBH_0019050 [Eimeria brunetti]|uniref:Uncharacterized protein n=1 Tax=Eimeria brunetti TaxID=51314 RepID=U6LCC4_9EIME|nr:hypothetical protein EBH_0019050 [Eimeria brunetti]